MNKILLVVFSLFIPLALAEKNKNTLFQNSKEKQKAAHKIQQKGEENATTGTPPKRHISLGTAKQEKEPEKEVQLIMNDPLMKKKWDLQKTNVKDAWLKFSKGSKDIIVAIIDTGTDINHPDLKANIWVNKKEIPGNGLDDDKNGYIDDINGWNFVKNNNNIKDTHGHGTHIAGIIGAEGGNGIGISGVAPKVSLMTLKYYDINDNGKNNLNNTIKAIHYAIQNGAHIINYSGGGLNGNEREKQAIQEAERKGILFVAASGNEKSNMDKSGYYPAKYELSNILPVTATDHSDKVLRSSNWGQKTVHKSAPGYNILSTLPGGKYGRMTGTSQATAVATGAAVLVMDYYKNKTAHFVIKQLKMTGDIKQSLVGKTSQRRRLNIFKALQARGKNLNFMDETVVDPSGKIFESDRDISSFVQGGPLSLKDLSEIKMVNEVLQRKPTEVINSSKKETVKNKENLGRNPSSKNQKKQSILKRWFFNKN
ncbi:MAG: S8 family serine peptidase [Oligoflexia bacterium]|nr:S8 family serine peptidase [Oligoflexia bacterium]